MVLNDENSISSGNSIPALYEFCQWVSELNRTTITLDETEGQAAGAEM
jgi:hypothetical protein